MQFVEDHARSTLRVAVDGRRVPACPSGRRYPVAIEVTGDLPRRSIGRISSEDTPDDLGFLLDDLQSATMAWDDAISVCPAAGRPERNCGCNMVKTLTGRFAIQNVGYGAANNLTIVSAQPHIVASIPANPIDQLLDNPGPQVDFNITGSSNTSDASGFQAGNLTVNFGTVAPGATVSGYWTLQASQRGFFIGITSTFSHSDYQGVTLDPLVLPPTTSLVPAIGGDITASSGSWCA